MLYLLWVSGNNLIISLGILLTVRIVSKNANLQIATSNGLFAFGYRLNMFKIASAFVLCIGIVQKMKSVIINTVYIPYLTAHGTSQCSQLREVVMSGLAVCT